MFQETRLNLTAPPLVKFLSNNLYFRLLNFPQCFDPFEVLRTLSVVVLPLIENPRVQYRRTENLYAVCDWSVSVKPSYFSSQIYMYILNCHCNLKAHLKLTTN